MPSPIKSPLAIALLVSALAHLGLAAYFQYATNLLAPLELQNENSNNKDGVINTVLLPAPPLSQRAASSKQNIKPTPAPTPSNQPTAEPAPAQQPTPAEEPTQKASATPPPADSEALPHEELARKKEVLPPSSAQLAEKPQQYSLPNQIKLSYEGAWGGTPVNGTLKFELKNNDYTASLQLLASVLFKTMELKQSVQGVLSAQGLEALRAEDKAINGRTVAITAEPDKQRVIISSKEGFLPYVAGGKDLVSVIIQLGILVQAQKEWLSKGAAQDFTVYRPSGIKKWRYQSQGIEKTQTGTTLVDTVYIKRVPQSSEPDFEYIHHLWLDASRHGMPIRIKLEDAKSGRVIDLTLKQWEEL